MKKLLVLGCLLSFMQISFAQNATEIKYANLINQNFLKKHLTIIAGAEMEGRETGTEGQRKAAAYIEQFFKTNGLQMPPAQNGYQQMYPLYEDSLLMADLIIGNQNAVYGSDFILNNVSDLSYTAHSNGVVFAGYGIEDENYSDYKNLDVKGKAVIIFLGEPKVADKYLVSGTDKSSKWTYPGIADKVALAAVKGATNVFIISPNQPKFSERSISNTKKTRMYFPSKEDVTEMATSYISHDFAKNILGTTGESLIEMARKKQAFAAKNFLQNKDAVKFSFLKNRLTTLASNVLGVVEGSDKKDEYIFVTGHYDHLGTHNGKIYYGADDDGSGTVAVMGMAAAFAKAKADGKGPRRTMVFMTVSGEEKGLWGSEYYSDNPIYSLDKTSVDLNIDMIGRNDTERMSADSNNYIYVVGNDKLSSDLPIISEGANNKYTKLVLDYMFDDPKDPNRIYFRSDHYNFARKGIPVLFYYDGMLKSDYHKPTDTVDKINWDLFEKRAKLVFYTAWEMANMENMLKRDIPLNMPSR